MADKTPTRNSLIKSKLGQGRRLEGQAKTIIGNVYDYFNRLHRQGQGNGPFKRTADATSEPYLISCYKLGRLGFCLSINYITLCNLEIGIRTVRNIILERDRLQQVQNVGQGHDRTQRQTITFESPARRYRHSRRKVQPDSFDIDAIRRKIYDFYERKEHLTILKLLKTVQDDGVFNGRKTLLKRLLHDIGFKYKRVDDRRYYYEQPHIIEQRKSYLCKMRQNRADKKPVVFLDETWANAHDGKDVAWVEEDTVTGGTLGGVRRPSGKGKRLIILGAGGEMGWIPNSTLIFQSKKNTGDYHDEMTGEHFEEWFKDKLLPNIPPNSLITMDNASYHSRIEEENPKKSWTKSKMIEWLVYYDVSYDANDTKSQLFSIIQDAAKRMGLTHTKYIVDEMALKAGHEVVRLPVAHCTLNPIELAWAQVKGHIKKNTSQFNLGEVERLAWEGFEVVTKERWADLVKHVRDKVEDRYWQNDNLDIHEQFRVSDFVIHVGGESDDDPTSELDSASDPDSLNDSVAAIDNDEDV